MIRRDILAKGYTEKDFNINNLTTAEMLEYSIYNNFRSEFIRSYLDKLQDDNISTDTQFLFIRTFEDLTILLLSGD